MTVKRNDAARRCEIWIDYGERSTYAMSEEYRETVRRYRALGYRVCVFLGGSEPLLPGVAALLDRQTGLF
ncbi:MAG: hypothetical protein ACI3XZ_01345 [Butyricicoccus sp.]